MRFLILLLISFSFPAVAQVYTWTDENGVTHFGTQPPPGQQESVDIRNNRISNQPPAAESDIVRRARELERQQQSQAAQRQYRQRVQEVQQAYDERPDYICTGAENRLKSVQERWEAVKRQGYSISDQRFYEQQIRDRQRHRDNVCR